MKRLLLIISVLSLLTGCGKSPDQSTTELVMTPYKQTKFLMCTVVTVKIYDKDKEGVLEPAFNRIEELAQQIDVGIDGSVINEINENAGLKPVQVPEDLYRLITKGKAYSKKAEGTFDISVGPLTSLWHIGFDDARKPNNTEIEAVLPLINFNQIDLNKEDRTVFLREKGMSLDLGAIAKGFITDEVVSILKQNDVTTAIVDLGGNIYVMGNNSYGKDWTVGIQNPFAERGELVGSVPESNQSIVTSGIYERYLEIDGVKYHHILNPVDGYPYNNEIAGVTIISDKSLDGDALSTSVYSKGLIEGMKYIENFEGIEAIFISRDKKVYITSGLKKSFKLANPEFEITE